MGSPCERRAWDGLGNEASSFDVGDAPASDPRDDESCERPDIGLADGALEIDCESLEAVRLDGRSDACASGVLRRDLIEPTKGSSSRASSDEDEPETGVETPHPSLVSGWGDESLPAVRDAEPTLRALSAMRSVPGAASGAAPTSPTEPLRLGCGCEIGDDLPVDVVGEFSGEDATDVVEPVVAEKGSSARASP